MTRVVPSVELPNMGSTVSRMKTAEPSATSASVRRPAGFRRSSRSRPISAPAPTAAARRRNTCPKSNELTSIGLSVVQKKTARHPASLAVGEMIGFRAMNPYIAETVGTMILILLGDGVVANVLLARSKGQNSGWIVITVGWGVAVTIAVYSVGRISGAHLNPAVTIALATIGSFPWGNVAGYVAAQMVGAFLGAVLVWLAYLQRWRPTDNPPAKLAVFSTGPAIPNTAANFATEAIGTAMLLFGVLAISANAEGWVQAGEVDLSQVFSRALQPLLVGILVLGIGLSLGGPTGYAINPARDLGPRIAHAVLPIPAKGTSDWSYAWIPILAPIVGGIAGAALYTFVGF